MARRMLHSKCERDFTHHRAKGFKTCCYRFFMRSPKLLGRGLRSGEKPKMIFPSITILIIGVTVFAALAALEWYVWGMTPVRRYPFAPGGTRFAEDGQPGDLRNVA